MRNVATKKKNSPQPLQRKSSSRTLRSFETNDGDYIRKSARDLLAEADERITAAATNAKRQINTSVRSYRRR